MGKCAKDYGNHCFDCKKIESYFEVVSTGRGMDSEMLSDFGERKIAINCPFKKGYFVLDLTRKQIKELTQGKLEEISEESAKKGLIKGKMIKDYLTKNTNKIQFYMCHPCTMLPNYP